LVEARDGPGPVASLQRGIPSGPPRYISAPP